jgi:hypothetical protein
VGLDPEHAREEAKQRWREMNQDTRRNNVRFEFIQFALEPFWAESFTLN